MSLVLVPALFAALSAQIPSVAGAWNVQISIAGNDSTRPCTFVQQESALSGTCESRSGEVKISGKLEGKSVTWTYKTEYDGNPLTVTFRGTLSADDKIAGTVTAVEFGAEGEFSATRKP